MDMLTGFMNAVKPMKDGGLVDRINYFYTTVLLTVFAIFISGWAFVGEPIQCWFPAYYKGGWTEYAKDYCFVQNTYFLPFTEEPAKNYWDLGKSLVHIPKNITHREDKLIGYYQWVSFVLAIEAMLFYLPVVIWRSLYSASGINVKSIMETTTNADNMTPETRKKNMQLIANFLSHSWDISEHMHGKRTFTTGRYITSLFLFIKVLFAINCVGQFFLLQQYLGLNHFWWGADVLVDLASGREWPETGNFPRVTLCDFEVRVLGNLHRHTVQCVLMINMFNEKIFLLLWWWYLLVGILSIASLLYWTITSIIPNWGQTFVRNYLSRIDKQAVKSVKRRQLIGDFMKDTLKPDGIFLLRLIAANAGDLVCSELLETLWNTYKRKNAIPPTPDGEAGNRLPPSAPPVKLAGQDYPTLPIGGGGYEPLPPKYEDSMGDDLRQRKPPNVRESDL